MVQTVKFEDLVFSDEVAAAWDTLLNRLDMAVTQLRAMGRTIRDGDIVVTAIVERDGSLTLHVKIREFISAAFPVPPEHWARKQ